MQACTLPFTIAWDCACTFCTLPSTIARDCSCTSQMQACTLPFTIARDCTCTFAPCPLRLPGIAVALYALAPCTLTRVMCQREGEREMETLGRRREKKCRDALSFSLRKKQLLCYKRENKTFGPICICKNGFVDIGPQRRIFTP